ncbi:MAG: YihY/virulence factor BrkB family protein [Bacteroidales bacterium]|nr:YihY/virulence factor BrkB family protein [Bacteroidales bacterium]
MSILEKINYVSTHFVQFVTVDIWRITENEVSRQKNYFYNLLKTLILSGRRFQEDMLQTKASALTYSTLLAIVPILALLFAIAGGLGFKALIETQLIDYFPAQREILQKGLTFAYTYLEQVKGGVFVGVGLLMLFWAIMSLISNIEVVFNGIWQVKKSRTYYRKFTDYFSLFLILPVLMIASSGLSIFITTAVSNLHFQMVIGPLLNFALRMSPYVITWLIFMFLYIFLPNTKVRIVHAIIPSLITSVIFNFFQYLYINGQIWVTSYNAIYGSFAALPLLLLWLQISWLIVLFGAVLTCSSQNIQNYSFESDTQKITRRYKDFVILSIASIVIKRFEKGEKPFTADEISLTYRIPNRLTKEVLYLLTEIDILNETLDEEEEIRIYQPSFDINQITVALLLERVDKKGSEDFKIDKQKLFKNQWNSLLISRDEMSKTAGETLVKDLMND